MNLLSSNLEAFKAVAKHLSFSKGAGAIHITQSAISHRIKNLEDELGQALFVRHPSGVRLTPAGELLAQYCRSQDSLQEELRRDLASQVHGELAGYIRIAAYSSVCRSVVMPALAGLLKKNPKLTCEFLARGMRELPELLRRGDVEFIVTDHALSQSKVSSLLLGYESYVVIESARHPTPAHTYLDNAPDDRATEDFLRSQNKPLPPYNRLFMADCYGILDGVEQGLGRAVMPEHLLKNNPHLRQVEGFRRYLLEVYVHYYTQPYYSSLQQKIIASLQAQAPKLLSQPPRRKRTTT